MQATPDLESLERPGPYSRPIRELLDFLAVEFGIAEEAPVRVLLGALLPLDGFRPPRLTLETDWLSRYFDTSAWFTLGGLVHPYSLGMVRAPGIWRRAQHVLAEANDRERATGIASVFVEPDWHEPVRWQAHAKQYAENYLAESLRVRVHQPKRVETLDRQKQEARTAQMQFLVKNVLQLGLRSWKAPEARFPPNYAYWCELALKLVPPWPPIAWQWLSAAIAETAVRSAALEGRARANERDWSLAGKALSWQVPAWTAGLLQTLGEGHTQKRGATSIDRKQLSERIGTAESQRTRERKRAEARAEAKRLEREGALKYRPAGKEWRLANPPTCCHVLRVLEGRAFDGDSQEAVGPHQRGWNPSGKD